MPSDIIKKQLLSLELAIPSSYDPETNSYFIPKPDSMSSKEFVDKMFELGNKYNQDTILLVCKSEGYCGVYKTKSRTIDNPFPTGKIQVNKIEQAYSRMRGKNIPFVFK